MSKVEKLYQELVHINKCENCSTNNIVLALFPREKLDALIQAVKDECFAYLTCPDCGEDMKEYQHLFCENCGHSEVNEE